MTDAFKKTMRREGLGAFFKGFGAVASMTMPAHALYFGSYEASKNIFQRGRREEEKSAWVIFVSGFIADVCGSLIWTPMDVIKQRVQMAQSGPERSRQMGEGEGLASQGAASPSSAASSVKRHAMLPKSAFNNSWEAFRTIVREEGVIGLYRGLPVALATFGPYVGLYFTFYEQLKWKSVAMVQRMSGEKEKISSASSDLRMQGELPDAREKNLRDERADFLPLNLACAFVAASMAALITCPIDVVKTNIQVYSVKHGGYADTMGAMRALYREGGGLKVFFRGWNARILWLAPGSAITMAAYEQCKSAVSFIATSS